MTGRDAAAAASPRDSGFVEITAEAYPASYRDTWIASSQRLLLYQAARLSNFWASLMIGARVAARRGLGMTNTKFDADALIDASLPLLGLSLEPESRVTVKLHLTTAETLSRLVRDFPLDDEAEPAPVYTA